VISSLPLFTSGKCWRRCCLAALALLLAACGTTSNVTAPANADFELHRQAILAAQDWQLSGRLSVRQNNDSERVSLNWKQNAEDFDITLWGTLGLGSTRIFGSDQGLTIEKPNEAPVQLSGLDALSREYLVFDFPAAYLLYWVRGVPVPQLPASQVLDGNNLLSTLSQRDPSGRNWDLSFDRYRTANALNLPGRIRVTSGNIQLIFLVDDWQLPSANSN
jgi:outer membrane lipoprotein LolB